MSSIDSPMATMNAIRVNDGVDCLIMKAISSVLLSIVIPFSMSFPVICIFTVPSSFALAIILICFSSPDEMSKVLG